MQLLRADNYKPLQITVGGEEVFGGWIIDTMSGEEGYRREFTVPDALVQKYLRKKRVGGEEVCVLPIRFSGLDGQQSVRICEFIYIYAAEK